DLAETKPLVTTKLVDFRDVTGVLGSDRSVMYFFVANGRFLPDSESISKALNDPRARHSYLFKVEVMSEQRPLSLSAEQMSDFLKHLLPELQRLLPDWQAAEKER